MRSGPRHIILLAAFLGMLAPHGAFSQQRLSSFLYSTAPSHAGLSLSVSAIDSQRIAVQDSIAPIPKSKSGRLAMILSAVLPGAGQVYAERYYTIPVIWGLGAYFASQWVKADNHYQDFARQFSASVLADSVTKQGNSQLKDIRDFYHDQRDEFAIYIGLTYLLNIVDAYVGATLYGFDVSDNLGGSSQIRFRIPIR